MPRVRCADRRELAVLGLVVLGWGLLVSPLLHRETHAHGATHSHGAPSKQAPVERHGAGSLEHGSFALAAAPALPPVVVVQLALAVTPVVAPEAPWRAPARRVEQSQAP